ncbi:MAG: DUF305 domain-containing protein [Dehalococcoidia bacterium]
MYAMYWRFGLILATSLVLMFLLSMAQIDVWDHFYVNLSNFYLSLIMVSTMGAVMMVGMWGMFPDRRLNAALTAGFVVLAVVFFVMGRVETFVGNEGFLHSMIPHHSRAVLVCQEANITDPEIADLCDGIIKTQLEEIAQMKAILERY